MSDNICADDDKYSDRSGGGEGLSKFVEFNGENDRQDDLHEKHPDGRAQ